MSDPPYPPTYLCIMPSESTYDPKACCPPIVQEGLKIKTVEDEEKEGVYGTGVGIGVCTLI